MEKRKERQKNGEFQMRETKHSSTRDKTKAEIEEKEQEEKGMVKCADFKIDCVSSMSLRIFLQDFPFRKTTNKLVE